MLRQYDQLGLLVMWITERLKDLCALPTVHGRWTAKKAVMPLG